MNDSRFETFESHVHDALPTDERADRIVAAALAQFGERGYAAARLADIARRAGVSATTLSRHFPSKAELFREVVRSTLLDVRGAPGMSAAESGGSAADAVRAFVRDYWRTMERPELIAIVRLAIGELPRFPELAMLHATERLERLVRLLERIIRDGITRGELRLTTDARAAARMILATAAAHALWFAYPTIYAGVTGADRERAAEATIEALVQTLVIR
ncbi:MAG TPA: TetR/AcrR family transcriptional regulator [Gemmatimonadaceae bacterium]|nr:TetR/AcrR family transcriptional regulator [Gemmatimonadaceae bacterium]